MALPTKRIAAAVAWGVASYFASEMLLAGVFGARAGARLGRGRSVDEVTASLGSAFSAWDKAVPPLAGAAGLILGLLGLLPGTEAR